MPDRQTLQHLLETMTLTRQDDSTFTAQNTHPDSKRLYGGQVLAQALRAGLETVTEERVVHSQHAYFLRPGDGRQPITLDVEIARDGGTFSSRRVVASQAGRIILVSSLSFQVPELGDNWQPEPLAVAGPEGLETERERSIRTGTLRPEFQIIDGLDLDVRIVNPFDWLHPTSREGRLQLWLKTTGPIGSERGLHETLLSYMSDCCLVDVTLMPNGRSFFEGMQIASLDHAIWFHQPVRVDEWLLLDVDIQFAGGGRGLARGRFYTSEGELVATCMQECLQRLKA